MCQNRLEAFEAMLAAVQREYADILSRMEKLKAEKKVKTVTDFLFDPDDIADTAVLIFYSHIDNAAVVGFPVKGDMDLNAPLSKLLPDIVGKSDVCTALSVRLPNYGLVFISS